MKRLLSLLPFFIGILFFGYFIVLLFRHFSPPSLAFASVPSLSVAKTTELPTVLTIPALNRSLPVVSERLTKGKWQTTDKGVSYLLGSGLIGEKGNAVFYGHDLPKLLGGLDAVQVGDRVLVTAVEGRAYSYTVVEKKIVDPTDVSVIQRTSDSRLTLYTCTGWLDSKRLVLIATLTK